MLSSYPPGAALPVEVLAQRIEQLEEELNQIKRVLSRKQIELSQLVTERDTLAERIIERDTRIRELESELAKGSAARASSDQRAELKGRVRELEARVALHAETVAGLREHLAEALTQQPVSGEADNLKRLNGIGPAFERGLKSLGVCSFEQIAGWSSEDIAWVAKRLKVSPARILRDDWVGGARKLAGRRP